MAGSSSNSYLASCVVEITKLKVSFLLLFLIAAVCFSVKVKFIFQHISCYLALVLVLRDFGLVFFNCRILIMIEDYQAVDVLLQI